MANRNYQSEHETITRYVQTAAELDTGEYLDRPVMDSPEKVYGVVGPILANADREHCMMLALDTQNRLMSLRLISVGSVANTFMRPREIYREALNQGASTIIVAHNHPSGDCTPSQDDKDITRRLSEAGSLLGIELLDHIVVGVNFWSSLARMGEL